MTGTSWVYNAIFIVFHIKTIQAEDIDFICYNDQILYYTEYPGLL
jgi:hypothetical protein